MAEKHGLPNLGFYSPCLLTEIITTHKKIQHNPLRSVIYHRTARIKTGGHLSGHAVQTLSLLAGTWRHPGGVLVTSWSFLKQPGNSWAGQSPRAATAGVPTSGRGVQAGSSLRVPWSPAQNNDTESFQPDTLETCAQHFLGLERSVFAIKKSQTLFSLCFSSCRLHQL